MRTFPSEYRYHLETELVTDLVIINEAMASNSNNHSAANSIIYRQFSLLPRTIKEWNKFQSEATTSNTLVTFVSKA